MKQTWQNGKEAIRTYEKGWEKCKLQMQIGSAAAEGRRRKEGGGIIRDREGRRIFSGDFMGAAQ